MNINYLLSSLGYKFINLNLLNLALTHRSASPMHNERLEFLGDSVLSIVISELLFAHFPHANEGELSRMRATIICGKTLAQVAKELQINNYLKLGGGELKSGGLRRESILADTLEAIIGAIYLDGGIEACRGLLSNWFSTRLQSVTPDQQKDPKTKLQEKLQGEKANIPTYEVVNITGAAHELTFEISCKVDSLKEPVLATGGSRRKAEQNAALKILELLTPTK